jgi:hypothetical protein
MSTMTIRPALRTRYIAGAPLLRSPSLVWAALFLNVLTFLRMPLVLPLPGPLGQAIAQGALPAAIVLGVLANPRLRIRPHLVLVLMTAMAVAAVLVGLHNTFLFGSMFRAVRLLEFVVVLWLLSPWWGSSQWVLLRAHLRCLTVALASVVIGAVLAPGIAFPENNESRLSGAIWPLTPTQVAHFSAVLLGCVTVLWFSGRMAGRWAVLTALSGGAILLATHTRTALLALVVGLVVAGGSLFVGYARVRRAAGAVVLVAVLTSTLFAPVVGAWASRGQSTEQVYQLTGRTVVWTSIFSQHRPWHQEFFGEGLSNKSYNGVAIDSSWVATYHELGWFGVALGACFLLLPLMTAATRPPGPQRAIALFLLCYCLVSSFTETGLGDASPYLLEVVVAASLLALPAERSR